METMREGRYLCGRRAAAAMPDNKEGNDGGFRALERLFDRDGPLQFDGDGIGHERHACRLANGAMRSWTIRVPRSRGNRL